MIMVALLLINMLIAMMGNTYQLVNETQKEWLRQVITIINNNFYFFYSAIPTLSLVMALYSIIVIKKLRKFKLS